VISALRGRRPKPLDERACAKYFVQPCAQHYGNEAELDT